MFRPGKIIWVWRAGRTGAFTLHTRPHCFAAEDRRAAAGNRSGTGPAGLVAAGREPWWERRTPSRSQPFRRLRAYWFVSPCTSYRAWYRPGAICFRSCGIRCFKSAAWLCFLKVIIPAVVWDIELGCTMRRAATLAFCVSMTLGGWDRLAKLAIGRPSFSQGRKKWRSRKRTSSRERDSWLDSRACS